MSAENIYTRCENCKTKFSIPKNKALCLECRSGDSRDSIKPVIQIDKQEYPHQISDDTAIKS